MKHSSNGGTDFNVSSSILSVPPNMKSAREAIRWVNWE